MHTLQQDQLLQQQEQEARTCAAKMLQEHQRRRATRAEEKALAAQRSLETVKSLAERTVQAAAASANLDRKMDRAKSFTGRMMVELEGQAVPLSHALSILLDSPIARSVARSAQASASKFVLPDMRELVLGRPEAAALGIASYLKVAPAPSPHHPSPLARSPVSFSPACPSPTLPSHPI